MDDIIDFNYTSRDLTQEVNRTPNTYGLVHAMGLAPISSKRSTLVRIDYKDGQIFVLGAAERGSKEAQSVAETKRSGVIVEVPHFPLIANISPVDLDNLLEVVNGKVTEASLDRELASKLFFIRMQHSITLEYLRLCMLRGVIKDGNGNTLHDLYDLFDIQKKTVSLGLDSENTDVRAKIEEVNDHVATKLLGDTSTGVESLVSTSLFTKLISHKNVEKFWLNAQNSSEHKELKRDYRGRNFGRVFEFGEHVFREYKGQLPFRDTSGNITQVSNVEADKGYAFPVGTQNLFRTFDAPAFHIDHVNEAPDSSEEGQFILITAKVLDHGEGVELKSQSNALPMCKQPDALVELTV